MEEMNSQQEMLADELYMYSAFETDELMMSYYLLLNNILNPKMGVLQCPEHEVLQAMQRKLRQIVDLLQLLDDAPWKQCVGDVNKICGTHLVLGGGTVSDKIHLNRRIGRYLAFMTELASGRPQIKQLLSIFNCHKDNVSYLLSKHADR